MFLQSLRDQNEVLFYRVCVDFGCNLGEHLLIIVILGQLISDHLKEMFSIIYTPTEGDAIEKYSHLFRRPEGCFLNIKDIESVEDTVGAAAHPDDVDYIVVTDGEEILGIGDQGVGSIGISTAKLALMTLCAGVSLRRNATNQCLNPNAKHSQIHPNRTLAVVLDCGTDVSNP